LPKLMSSTSISSYASAASAKSDKSDTSTNYVPMRLHSYDSVPQRYTDLPDSSAMAKIDVQGFT
jgi:hypothetical protein